MIVLRRAHLGNDLLEVRDALRLNALPLRLLGICAGRQQGQYSEVRSVPECGDASWLVRGMVSMQEVAAQHFVSTLRSSTVKCSCEVPAHRAYGSSTALVTTEAMVPSGQRAWRYIHHSSPSKVRSQEHTLLQDEFHPLTLLLARQLRVYSILQLILHHTDTQTLLRVR